MKGAKLRTLIDYRLPAKEHRIEWDGTDDNDLPVSSGIYFYKMKTESFSSTRKMILLK